MLTGEFPGQVINSTLTDTTTIQNPKLASPQGYGAGAHIGFQEVGAGFAGPGMGGLAGNSVYPKKGYGKKNFDYFFHRIFHVRPHIVGQRICQQKKEL